MHIHTCTHTRTHGNHTHIHTHTHTHTHTHHTHTHVVVDPPPYLLTNLHKTLVAEAQEKMGITMPNSSSQQSLTISIATTEGDTPQPGAPEAQSTPDTKRRVIPVPPPGAEGLRLQADNTSEGEICDIFKGGTMEC